MNYYIEAQIANMITMTNTFKEACSLAATADDGAVSREEEKTLKKLNAAADHFIHKLQTLK